MFSTEYSFYISGKIYTTQDSNEKLGYYKQKD